MPKKFPSLTLVMFLLFSVYTLSASAEDNKCAKLFNSNCAACHDLDRGCKRIGQSPKDWLELFKFMEEMGADIPEDEQTVLLDCFNKPDEGIKEKCK